MCIFCWNMNKKCRMYNIEQNRNVKKLTSKNKENEMIGDNVRTFNSSFYEIR
jgi:hypothetical protein